MGWEMSVGFSNRTAMPIWDGASWAVHAQHPAPDESAPPKPAPAADHAAAVAAAAAQPLHRGPSLPAELLASGSVADGGDAAAGSAASAAAFLAAGGAYYPPAAGMGADLSDPATASLLWQGLSFTGHTSGAAVSQQLLEAHYSMHGAFLLDAPLLAQVERLRGIPCIAVHGQLDFVCPPTTPYDLHCAWPEMELRMVPAAGHSMYDPAITHELVSATDRLRGVAADAVRRAAATAISSTGGGGGGGGAGARHAAPLLALTSIGPHV